MDSFFNHPLGVVAYFPRIIQFISAVIVLGITGWAVRETKTLTVIYTLVIAVVSLVITAVALLFSCMIRRQRWHIWPVLLTDGVMSYLWLVSFVFLAQNFDAVNCRVFLWNGLTACSRKYAAEAFSFIAFFCSLMALGLEIGYIYSAKPKPVPVMQERGAEERLGQNLANAGLM
ncbi:MARVEL domain-containing protein [Aspergillus saccharolyticus JOP 1030-1]|uniref:MARVEL domain-containing protein n=1 Tax=Aspergillus saccharolyticus JOP 1030-1 TaxID=1450539 RepID=A0A318ZRZ6_9EURO|nr:hypothetical protein BP01DRAFT_380978 [Aspergillus saccharolyticus JOP 1030-1]PYH47133.1 hypothetical protein BP01DRAFT_380978 [Aspergillus saccharolyticus JOP 1030-1]